MSYDIIESSEYTRAPVELFTFTMGTNRWTYTSSDSDKIVNGQKYQAVPIERKSFETSEDINK